MAKLGSKKARDVAKKRGSRRRNFRTERSRAFLEQVLHLNPGKRVKPTPSD